MTITQHPNSSNAGYYTQFHEPGQSPYNYDLDHGSIYWFLKGDQLGFQMLSHQTELQKINKNSFSCIEDNSNRLTNCINEYYETKLGCALPWINNNNNPTQMDLCKGVNKFSEFKKLSLSILQPGVKNELSQRGCFEPNCNQRSWNIRYMERVNRTGNEDSNFLGRLWYFLPHNSKVLVRTEVELYTFINFFAEVGGYLGLLLGESMLSYLIMGSHWLQIIGKKIQTKFQCKL